MSNNSKSSYYNFIVDTEDGGQVIYNTRTGAIDIIERESKNSVKKILANDQIAIEQYAELYDYMVKQGYIVDDNKDELYDIVQWSRMVDSDKRIAYLTILPTETCNFTCPYCFIYTFRERHMKPEVYDNIYKYVENFFEENKNEDFCVFDLSWFGGEPLLVSDQIQLFMKRLNKLKEKYPNAQLKSEITTNGYYLTYELFSELLSLGIDRYQITLDGDDVSHDKLRTLSQKRPTFNTIYQNILNIKENVGDEKDFALIIRSNFLRSTVANSEHLLEMYKKDFASDSRFRIYFRPVYNFETDRDDISQVECDLCGNEEGITIQNRLMLETLSKTENVLERVTNPLPAPTQSWCISVQNNSNIIGYDGSVFSCDTMIVEKEKSIGYLDEDGQIIFNDNAKFWKKNIFELEDENSKKCMNCKLLPVCMGGCNRARNITGKNPCFWTEKLIYDAMLDYSKLH